MADKNLADFIHVLDRMDSNSDDASDWLLKKISSDLLDKVKEKTPVDTGDLKDAWHIEFEGNDVSRVLNKMDYVGHVEFGHKTVGGNSFVPGVFMLRDAKDEIRNNMDRYAEDYIRRLLLGVGR